MPDTCWRLVAAGYEPAMSGQIEIKNESQASPMETPRAAQRYLSSESTRPAIADHPARRVPTFLRCRPRGGHRTGPGRRPAHHGPADLPRAPDTALRSRPLAGDRQRLVQRELTPRLHDRNTRPPRPRSMQVSGPPTLSWSVNPEPAPPPPHGLRQTGNPARSGPSLAPPPPRQLPTNTAPPPHPVSKPRTPPAQPPPPWKPPRATPADELTVVNTNTGSPARPDSADSAEFTVVD